MPDMMLGMTRSMLAMSQFTEMKQKYDEVFSSSEEYQRRLEECHVLGAQRMVQLVSMQRGLYVKAAQFVASIRGGVGDQGIPRQYIEACAQFTDHAPHKQIAEMAQVLKASMHLGDWPEGP